MRTDDESSCRGPDLAEVYAGRMEPVPNPAAGPLVLCVDDETVGLRVRKILLERAGYRVLTALDGASGLELFAGNPVAAVVLDYSMPGMSGGEVAERMHAIKPETPILMLSAYTSLPPEVAPHVALAMTKGEGAPVLLERLNSLLHPKFS